MIEWNKRTPEIANLLNPAFCALILYSTIGEYQKKEKKGLPFSLVYLVLPIILHCRTRSRVNSRRNMIVWLQDNPDVLVGFPQRARSLVPFTNEALEFLLSRKYVMITGQGLEIIKPISQSKINAYLSGDSEVTECIKKSEHVGRWFSNMRAEENIYIAWGVRP